jgi:S1-C subfamily serine protease
MKKIQLMGVLVLAVAALACSTESFLTSTVTPAPPRPIPASSAFTPTPLPPSAGAQLTSEEMLLENLYLRVNPAVVNISVSSEAGGQLTEVGSGSGFVIDTKGHIVTNNRPQKRPVG